MAIPPILLPMSPAQVMAERNQQAQPLQQNNREEVISNLSSYLWKCWQSAYQAKINSGVWKQMLINQRQKASEYEPEKLAAIRKMDSAEVYMGITDTKCRHAIAWINDLIFASGTNPFAIEPTPVPRLNPEIEAQVERDFAESVMEVVAQRMMQSGQQVTPEILAFMAQKAYADMEGELREKIFEKAKEKALEMQKQIEDQLTEGGWYDALRRAIYDLIVIKNGIIKGPVERQEVIRRTYTDPKTLKLNVDVQKKIIPTYERCSPLDIFPSPESTGPDDGYMFHKVSYTRKQLYEMIGLEGFNEEEIRAVLQEHRSGGLRMWTEYETEQAKLENKDTSSIHETPKIDTLEFWGSVPGNLLILWGMSTIEIPDEEKEYNVSAWMIGRHVIKAMINEDPFGSKPFSTTSFEDVPNSFWGSSLPEKIADVQQICNACARAIINNVGIASGPQVEVDDARISGDKKKLWPWKVWVSTNKMMNSGPAVNFYQPPMVVEKLMNVYSQFSKIADEHSGVPAYAHGDPNVGGGGNTASGLSMLISQAARGIKDVIRNIDDKLIVATVRKQYFWNLTREEYQGIIGDLKIVAKGSSAVVEKEQKAIRMVDVLARTNNPVDVSLMGADGRAYILEETLKLQDLDPEKALPGRKFGKLQLPVPENAAPEENPTEVDLAGNPRQGKGYQLIEGRGGSTEAENANQV